MGHEQYGHRSQAPSLDHLARAYREMLARDQAMLELLTADAVYLLQLKPTEPEG